MNLVARLAAGTLFCSMMLAPSHALADLPWDQTPCEVDAECTHGFWCCHPYGPSSGGECQPLWGVLFSSTDDGKKMIDGGCVAAEDVDHACASGDDCAPGMGCSKSRSDSTSYSEADCTPPSLPVTFSVTQCLPSY